MFNIGAFVCALQEYAARHGVSIDSVDLVVSVRDSSHPPASFGITLTGISIEGAAWCPGTNSLAAFVTRNVHHALPPLHLTPTHSAGGKNGAGSTRFSTPTYRCPLYRLPGTPEVTISNGCTGSVLLWIDLPCGCRSHSHLLHTRSADRECPTWTRAGVVAVIYVP